MKLSFPEVIDNSLRSSWIQCQTKAMYRSFFNLRSNAGDSTHLVAGHAFARGTEVTRQAFYDEDFPAADAISKGIHALITDYGDHVPSQHGSAKYKTCERMVDALLAYFDTYKLGEDWLIPHTLRSGRKAIEFTFANPLPFTHPETGNPLLMGGRSDCISFDTQRECVIIQDEKTTYALGERWAKQWSMDSQIPMYIFNARLSGIEAEGGVIRGIGIQAKNITFSDIPIYPNDWELDRWYNEFCEDVEAMLKAWTDGGFRMACDKAICGAYGGCEFELLCKSEHPQQWMESNYVVSTWSPLHTFEGD